MGMFTTSGARRGVAAGLALAFGLSVAAAAPASAKFIDSGSFDVEESYTSDECGFPLAFEQRFAGNYTISSGTPQTGGEFFRFSQSATFTGTVTNPETGDFFTESWKTRFRELPAKLVKESDDVVTYKTRESGQWDVFRDSDGKIVYLNAGTVVTEYTFDTLGDSAPGGEFLSEGPDVVHGRFDSFGRDFCEIAEELVG